MASAAIAEDQVGGHRNVILESDEHSITKKGIPEEIAFYETLDQHPGLADLVPRYLGVNGDNLVLENLTAGFSKPCVMDIKIGPVTKDAEAGTWEHLKGFIKDNLTPSRRLGYRIIGYRVWETAYKQFYQRHKRISQLTQPCFITDQFKRFLAPNPSAIFSYLDQLRKVKQWMETQGGLQLIGSSLLLVHEGDPTVAKPHEPVLRVIDFAHNQKLRPGEVDTNFLAGLEGVERTLSSLVPRH